MSKFKIGNIIAKNVVIGSNNQITNSKSEEIKKETPNLKKIKRPAIPQLAKVRATLQKEVNSVCPLCSNEDVGHFQIHHIDENPSNNDHSNLILVCPTCHSKITKNEVSIEHVREIKAGRSNSNHLIEFVNVTLDQSCNWKVSKKNPLAFFEPNNEEADLPVLNFSFVNHFSKTVVLKTITAEVKYLPSGLSGLGPEPYTLQPSVKYRLVLVNGEKTNVLNLQSPLAIPSERAFSFQVEVCTGYMANVYPIENRVSVRFTFSFSQNMKISIPPILFNCHDEDEKLIVRLLT